MEKSIHDVWDWARASRGSSFLGTAKLKCEKLATLVTTGHNEMVGAPPSPSPWYGARQKRGDGVGEIRLSGSDWGYDIVHRDICWYQARGFLTNVHLRLDVVYSHGPRQGRVLSPLTWFHGLHLVLSPGRGLGRGPGCGQ